MSTIEELKRLFRKLHCEEMSDMEHLRLAAGCKSISRIVQGSPYAKGGKYALGSTCLWITPMVPATNSYPAALLGRYRQHDLRHLQT